MKIITLNIWGGHIRQPLLDFVTRHQDIDIFCLQEVYDKADHTTCSLEGFEVDLNILSELHARLPRHRAFFRPVVGGGYGIGMLVKDTVNVVEEGEVKIHDNPDYTGTGPMHRRNLQWLRLNINDRECTVANVHCLWNGQGKTDTPERISQSKCIKDFMDTCKGLKILCGDFNLRPDTESLKIVEVGMTNLVKTYGVTSTRTSFYPKEEKFADYVLVSSEVQVKHFEVMSDEVSDHSPLYLEL